MLHYLWIALIGFVAGLVARALHPGKDNLGIIMTIVLGIAGAFIATFLGKAMGLYNEGESAGFIMSVIGAIILLVIYGFIVKKKDGGSGSST
ncbi:MAG TPA: GlsB/YeaQ/YmgE family stress response membrane protein [Burkholderiales bacterium]|nr:GlsB/YeaQ/YmgE family stress response membrane protein [Burkholderiales bacterium]